LYCLNSGQQCDAFDQVCLTCLIEKAKETGSLTATSLLSYLSDSGALGRPLKRKLFKP